MCSYERLNTRRSQSPSIQFSGGQLRNKTAKPMRLTIVTRVTAARWRAVILPLIFAISSCATVPERQPLPESQQSNIRVLGRSDLRLWEDDSVEIIHNWARPHLNAYRARSNNSQGKLQTNILALSGGAEDGAFGAGLLVGWSQSGGRPKFDLVTGVSAGALIAPFAYLGADYDMQLKEAFTTVSRSDIFQFRGPLSILSSNSIAEIRLDRLVARYFDQKFLNAVAREHLSGRVLIVGTANLDAQRAVLWDMGAIAASGHPESLALFRKVIVASASIPGLFPPVIIEVESAGKIYDELHVDGGIISQVFSYPTELNLEQLERSVDMVTERRIFVVRNGRLEPQWSAVPAKLPDIIKRSLSSLIKEQGMGDLYRIFLTSLRDNVDFNLAYITHEFPHIADKPFDNRYMNLLFEYGYRAAKHEFSWEKYPPGLAPRRIK